VEILPHLAKALRNLDYPGIMAQTPPRKGKRELGQRGGRFNRFRYLQLRVA
jgi:hypothetical protein